MSARHSGRCRQRIAILGAGIIGLLSARTLLGRGVEVVLVDCERPGRAASWAGGGIVSPLYPWRYPEAVSALADGAPEAHASLARELHAETGIDPQYQPCGMLVLHPDETAAALAWARRRRRAVMGCDAEALACLQPGIAPDLCDGLWWPDVGNVRNPRLLQALLAFIGNQPGVQTHWQATVDLRAENGDAELRVDGRVIEADAILLASGAWSSALLRPFGVSLAVRPVRGQMLAYAPLPGRLRRILLHEGHYLIPRRDGRILVGSTLEETGFDAGTTADARRILHEAAVRMLPSLATAAIEYQWAGLRPGSPEGIPFIDRVPGTRLFVNAGHFRNGLLLAPAAARLGVDLLLGERPALDPAPYSLMARRGTTCF